MDERRQPPAGRRRARPDDVEDVRVHGWIWRLLHHDAVRHFKAASGLVVAVAGVWVYMSDTGHWLLRKAGIVTTNDLQMELGKDRVARAKEAVDRGAFEDKVTKKLEELSGHVKALGAPTPKKPERRTRRAQLMQQTKVGADAE